MIIVSKSNYQSCLPFFNSVVFVDWNGVLSKDLFWSSIRQDPNHRYHKKLNVLWNKILVNDSTIFDEWMKGSITTKDILSRFEITFDKRYRSDFLERRLRSDCRKINLNSKLITALNYAKKYSFIVIATDNTDFFFEEVVAIDALKKTFDYLICSASIGVLKIHDVKLFFEPWLKSHNILIERSILIDDNKKTCLKYSEIGGNSIIFEDTTVAINNLFSWLKKLYNEDIPNII